MTRAEATPSPKRGLIRALIEEAWRRARRRRLALVALLGGCVAVSAALYFSFGGGGPGSGGPAATHSVPSQSQRALDRIVAHYGGTAIVSTRIGGPPPHWHYVSRGKPIPHRFKIAKWAYITVRAPCNCARANRAIWEGTVVGAALRDALRARHQFLYAAPVTLLLPDGREVKSGGGCCAVGEGGPFSEAPGSEIRLTIQRAARGTGLHVESIDVLRPERAAPAVVATTAIDPQAFVNGSQDLVRRLFFMPGRRQHRAVPAYEGYYLEVRRPNGQPFLILNTSFRSGAGGIWAPMQLLCGQESRANVSCPEAYARPRASDPFRALPAAVPGQLSGGIVYLTRPLCELRSFDLATGSDRAVRRLEACRQGWPVLAPNGEAVAVRGEDGKVRIERSNGTRLVLPGAVSRTPRKELPVTQPVFSPDSRRIAHCVRTAAGLEEVVADVETGSPLATVRGTCQVVLTRDGNAAVLGRRLLLNGRTIYRLRSPLANSAPGAPPANNPLATNPAGTLLAVATRGAGNLVAIHVFDLDGRQLAEHRARIDIPVAFQALAPSGRSAVIWWGDILQLATFRANNSISLRYNLGDHSGDGSRPIFSSSYSPDGKYAVMPRQASPPTSPLPALILSANGLKPLYRLRIHAQVAQWVR